MSTEACNPTTEENRVLKEPPEVSKQELELRFRKLTSFQQTILRFVSKLGDPHGLAIKEEMEAYFDDGEEIHHGRLYPNIDELVEQGFVRKLQKDLRTNIYVLANNAEAVISEETTRNAELVADT